METAVFIARIFGLCYLINEGLLTVHAVAALVLGAVLTFFGFFAA